jgi:hypothetical protein
MDRVDRSCGGLLRDQLEREWKVAVGKKTGRDGTVTLVTTGVPRVGLELRESWARARRALQRCRSFDPPMPTLLPALVLHATLGAASCPPDVCHESATEPEPPVEAERVRAMMRAFGRLRGARPVFVTTEGTALSPSMSVAAIERRLRADGGNAAFRVLYGRCASHDETCPWADVEVHVHAELDALDCDAATVRRVTRAGDQLVLEHAPEGDLQDFEVNVGPGGCAGEGPASGDVAPAGPRSAWIYLTGTHGMAHAALGQLPIRAIRRALAA